MAKLKPFKELTIKGQKMRIVKDAIAQIELKRFIVAQGSYLRFKTWVNNNDNLQKILKSSDNSCEVCAKGSLFASCVINVNQVYGRNDYREESFQSNKLSKWFTKQELDSIEAAFECWIVTDTDKVLEICDERGNSELYWEADNIHKDLLHDFNKNKEQLTELGRKSIKFGLKYKNPTNRLLAILSNILKNGEFCP